MKVQLAVSVMRGTEVQLDRWEKSTTKKIVRTIGVKKHCKRGTDVVKAGYKKG